MRTPPATAGPLTGFTIGVTACRRADEQIELLERKGATVLHGPATLPLKPYAAPAAEPGPPGRDKAAGAGRP